MKCAKIYSTNMDWYLIKIHFFKLKINLHFLFTKCIENPMGESLMTHRTLIFCIVEGYPCRYVKLIYFTFNTRYANNTMTGTNLYISNLLYRILELRRTYRRKDSQLWLNKISSLFWYDHYIFRCVSLYFFWDLRTPDQR